MFTCRNDFPLPSPCAPWPCRCGAVAASIDGEHSGSVWSASLEEVERRGDLEQAGRDSARLDGLDHLEDDHLQLLRLREARTDGLGVPATKAGQALRAAKGRTLLEVSSAKTPLAEGSLPETGKVVELGATQAGTAEPAESENERNLRESLEALDRGSKS